jgi:hypothetical protein
LNHTLIVKFTLSLSFSRFSLPKAHHHPIFILPEPYNYENSNDLLDILDETMELVILYHVIPSDATVMGEQCCAYSDPTFDFIYKVNCITDDSGMCDTIYVTLYDSLEMLGIEVQNELEEKPDKLGIERANYITEYLVAHGVDASRITSHSEGGIDTYTPTNANRNVIVRLFLP